MGINGNGTLTSDGYANTAGWPGLVDQNIGVTGADGAGLRGGSWSDQSLRLRISDRNDAANSTTAAVNDYGGRGVRTYDGT